MVEESSGSASVTFELLVVVHVHGLDSTCIISL